MWANEMSFYIITTTELKLVLMSASIETFKFLLHLVLYILTSWNTCDLNPGRRRDTCDLNPGRRRDTCDLNPGRRRDTF
jgi:hypothetical protein